MSARHQAAAERAPPGLPTHGALAGSAFALLVALGCIALFLPPLAERTLAAPLRTALTALALAGAMGLHWWLLGRAARRLRQSVAAWVGLSVALFPLGSAAALMLLGRVGRAPAPHGGPWGGEDAALPHHG